ncbi:MAG: ribonuclease P protein component [Saprospiraceae bacterium]|nr:ribonuclease P protein component [Saprospiraceae bacterium]
MNPETTGSGFPAKEKLKSRKKIQHLFEHGSSIVQLPFKMVYLFNKPEGDDLPLVQFSVSVPKRSFPRAHDRNRIKRKTREVYRLQKSSLLTLGQSKMIGLDMMWIYLGKTELDYHNLYTAATKLIQKTILAAEKKFRV